MSRRELKLKVKDGGGKLSPDKFFARVSVIPGLIFRQCFLASLILGTAAFAQTGQDRFRPRIDLPAETAGLDRIVSTLISAFDDVDIVALGDTHQRKIDSDLRIRLVRAPKFAQK